MREDVIIILLSGLNALFVTRLCYHRYHIQISEPVYNAFWAFIDKFFLGVREWKREGKFWGLLVGVVFLISFFLYVFLFELGLRWMAIVGSIGLYFYIFNKKLLAGRNR